MVSNSFMRMVYPCCKPSVEGENSSRIGDVSSHVDGLLWYKDLGRHVCGEFSTAAIQANYLMEDQSQLESGSLSSLESGPQGTFVGIYDGHGGPETARFVNDRLFHNLKGISSENHEITADVITRAFVTTEEEYLSLVREDWLNKPQIASVGSCCLVGIVCGGQLYIANAGDSRAVLGKFEKTSKAVKAVQLSIEHNASDQSVREELQSQHPDDPQIVVLKQNCWRVKGLIQVTRSIGDAYLKYVEFNKEPLLPKFRLSKPFSKPILRAEPTIEMRRLHPEDLFVIFASDGLWEHLSNQEAVNIVNTSPRNGIARRLVREALQDAAKKREMRYADLKKIERGVRRHFHDDITVIVLFLDSHLISRSSWHGPKTSIRSPRGISADV